MYDFQKEWAGRTFRCLETGETLVIPDDVKRRQFFTFGECFVDVGDGFYARFGGNMVEEVDGLADFLDREIERVQQSVYDLLAEVDETQELLDKLKDQQKARREDAQGECE